MNGSWPLSFFGSRIFSGFTPAGKRGAPSIIFLAVALKFQIQITLHTITMAEAAAMVWSGTAVFITNSRRRYPQWTDMTSWCEGISTKAFAAFILGVAYTKWPLFWHNCNNYTAPLMNRGPSGRKHPPITRLFNSGDNLTIIDEPAPFQCARNRRYGTPRLSNDAAWLIAQLRHNVQ